MSKDATAFTGQVNLPKFVASYVWDSVMLRDAFIGEGIGCIEKFKDVAVLANKMFKKEFGFST